MDKVVVGMIPQSRIKTTNSPYTDRYEFLDLYTNKILESGGLPVGLIASDGRIIEEYLDMCDAFFFPGGSKFEKYHFTTLDYAIKHNKPLLGVCLGMQAIGVYSDVIDYVDSFNEDNFFDAYNKLKNNYGGNMLLKMNDTFKHDKIPLNYTNSDKARHEIRVIDLQSKLYEILESDRLDVVSLHKLMLRNIGSTFKKTAISSDSVIEALEICDKDKFIMGVQWHPEWDYDNKLIRRLIKEGEDRKNGR